MRVLRDVVTHDAREREHIYYSDIPLLNKPDRALPLVDNRFNV